MADKTISGLPALGTISKEDVLLVVDDPAGTPVNRKISIENFFSNVEPIVFFSNTKGASSSEEASVVFKGGVGIKKNLIIDGDIEIRGATVQGTTTIGAVSDHILLTQPDTFDLANTANPFRTLYAGNVSPGESGIINVISSTTNFDSNVNFQGSEVILNSSELNVHSLTTFTKNVHVTSTVNLFSIDSKNLDISSNILLNGSDLNINSEVNFNDDITHNGLISLFDNNSFVANSNNFIVYGNVTLGLWSTDGNPKDTTTNVYISASNTYIKSELVHKGTTADFRSNLKVTSVNTSITSSNTYINSNIFVHGSTRFQSTKFEVYASNNYLSGPVTTKDGILIKSGTPSSSRATGALIVKGGLGVEKAIHLGEGITVGGQAFVSGNFIMNGDFSDIRSNTQFTGSNTFIESKNTHITGGNLLLTSNTHVLSNVNSSDSSSGSLVVDGGVGIEKDTNIGGNLNVAGNIHAIGNITANGNISLGDQSSDRLTLTARVNSDILPATTGTYDLGSTLLRFSEGYFFNIFASSNVQINDSVKVLGKRTRLQSTDTDIFGNTLNVTANTFFVSNVHSISGKNTHVTSNLTIDGTNTVITANLSVQNSNITLNSDETSIVGTNTIFSNDYTEFRSNTKIITTDFDILSNVNLTGELTVNGPVEFGQDGTSENIIIYGNSTSGEKIKYDATTEELTLNVEVIATKTINADSIKTSNNHLLLFGENLISENNENLITEDDNKMALENLSRDSVSAVSGGMRFSALNFIFGTGNQPGYGSSNMILLRDGFVPKDISVLSSGQTYIYSKPEKVKDEFGVEFSNSSSLHVMDENGLETAYGIHNLNGDPEIVTRNLNTGVAYRLNIFELARAVETLTNNTLITVEE